MLRIAKHTALIGVAASGVAAMQAVVPNGQATSNPGDLVVADKASSSDGADAKTPTGVKCTDKGDCTTKIGQTLTEGDDKFSLDSEKFDAKDFLKKFDLKDKNTKKYFSEAIDAQIKETEKLVKKCKEDKNEADLKDAKLNLKNLEKLDSAANAVCCGLSCGMVTLISVLSAVVVAGAGFAGYMFCCNKKDAKATAANGTENEVENDGENDAPADPANDDEVENTGAEGENEGENAYGGSDGADADASKSGYKTYAIAGAVAVLVLVMMYCACAGGNDEHGDGFEGSDDDYVEEEEQEDSDPDDLESQA